jgi:DNA-binding SARP family transcriptional activator
VVAAQLWPDASEEEGLARLRTTLWRLRRHCPAVVESGAGYLQLGCAVTVDVHDLKGRASRLLDRSGNLSPDDEDVDGLRRELLPDWWDEWVLMERESLRQLRLHALESLAGRLAALGRYAQALQMAYAAVSLDPLRETPHRQVMAIHLAEGNRSEALRCYAAYRDLLRAELGVEPSPQMEAQVAAARGDVLA